MPDTKIRRFPNVRDVQHSNEIKALEKRYHVVKESAKGNNSDKSLFYFEYFVQKTAATINVSLIVLSNLLENEKAIYQNYYQRLSFEPKKFDEDREFVDMILFGKYRHQMRYAALCLSGAGLTAYGECCMYLKIEDIEEKISLLEENSFIFFDKYPPRPLKKRKFPYGYRSDWENRGKLAVAKLGHKIKNSMQVSDFASILLQNTGDKAKDDFIVKTSKTGQTKKGKLIEKRRINFVKEKLATLGKKWVEA